MGIADLIRPKWKNSNPEIRIKAVQEMNISETERLQKIAAEDTDFRVRVEAVRRIGDENFLNNLHDLAFGQGESEVAKAVKERLYAIYLENIFQAQDTLTRLSLMEKIDDEETLTAVACGIDDPDIRLAASEKISDPDKLCRITESNCGLKTGMAIVERLSETEHLTRISRNASNKKVKKQAQSKLDAIFAEINKPSPEEELNMNMENLCVKLESLSIGDDWKETEKLILEIQDSWNGLNPDENHTLTERFTNALSKIKAEIKAVQEKEKVKSELENLCLEAEKIDGGNGEERIVELKQRWNNVKKDIIPDSALKNFQIRFEQGCELFEKNLEKKRIEEAALKSKIDRLEIICRKAGELSQKYDMEDADQKWDALKNEWNQAFFNHPDTVKLKKEFEKSFADYERQKKEIEDKRKQEIEAQEKKLMELCEIAEQADNAEDRSGLEHKIRGIQQEWKDGGTLIPEIKEALAPRFQNACDSFFSKQREYWEYLEWERWANLNQKKELCEIVEMLAQKDESEGIAGITREAQNKWKEIGPVSKENADEIWKRFNSACDQVYQKCLAKKTILYEQIKELIGIHADEPDINPESVNWTETAEKVKEIQTAWNAVGALPLSMEKDLRDGFQDICNAFFENRRKFYQQRDEERQNNLKIKTELCEKAEALALSEEWTQAAGQLKEFQRLWKETGPVPKGEDNDLWQRFRTACNTFFDRMKQEEPENLKQKEILCSRVEELVSGITDETDIEKISRELIELQKQWKEIGPVPVEQAEAVWKRFHQPCDNFFAQRKEHLKQREGEQEQNREFKEDLIARSEILSGSTEWKETGEKLKELQQRWKEIGPAPRKIEQELWVKFRKSCDHFFTRRKNFFENIDKERHDNLKKKENLCLYLEALARLVLPEDKLEGHCTIPTAEQLSAALEYKNEVVVPGNPKATWDRAIKKVRDIQKEWKEIGPVPHEHDEEVWKRFRNAADIFFSFRPVSDLSDAEQEKEDS